MQDAMAAAIEQKKQAKFSAMVEKGAAIASQQQSELMGKIVDSSVNSKNGNVNERVSMAIFDQAKKVDDEQ